MVQLFQQQTDQPASPPGPCGGGQGGCGGGRMPGKGEGGCAFRGAKRALQPIADAAHLVHGLASCEAGSWEARPTASSGPTLYRHSLVTAMGEIDTVMGGEAKLARAIAEVVAAHDPPAVFVYQTCLPAMIGDDLVRVCREASRRWNRPVVAVDAAGYAGSRVYGIHVAAQALLDHVVGSCEPEATAPTDIVLVGEFNLADELGRIRPLFARLGLNLVATVSGDGRIADIARAHRAGAVVQVCSQGLTRLAEGLRDQWGVPFIQGSFYGPVAIADTLRRLAPVVVARGGPADLPERVEALLAAESARVEPELAPLRRRLAGKRVLLLTSGVKTWSLAALLHHAGLHLVATTTGSASDAEMAAIGAQTGGNVPVWTDWEQADVDRLAREGAIDIVVGGGMAQFVARRTAVAFLDINHERSLALTGFDGTVALLAAIDQALSSPIWPLVRRPAPWIGRDNVVIDFLAANIKRIM